MGFLMVILKLTCYGQSGQKVATNRFNDVFISKNVF